MTPDEQYREVERLNKGRLLRDASAELLPMLNKMREETLSQITHAHTAGEGQKLPSLAAELSVIERLRAKITQNNKLTAHLEGKLDNGRPE